jgi:hypothetical protein
MLFDHQVNLIIEAYKRVNPNEYRFPHKPKFNVGDTALVKKYIESTYVGSWYNTARHAEDWRRKEYNNIIGKIQETYSQSSKRGVMYYYKIFVTDERIPHLNNSNIYIPEYDLRRTRITQGDTKDMVDLTNL